MKIILLLKIFFVFLPYMVKIFLITFFLSLLLQAQWNENLNENLKISEDVIESSRYKTVETTQGAIYIVWAQEETNSLKVQYIDEDGYKHLGEDGVLLSNVILSNNYGNNIDINLDSETDNLYISYIDEDLNGRILKIDQ